MTTLQDLYDQATREYYDSVEKFNNVYFQELTEKQQDALRPVLYQVMFALSHWKKLEQVYQPEAFVFDLQTATAGRNTHSGRITVNCPTCGNEDQVYGQGVHQCGQCTVCFLVNKIVDSTIPYIDPELGW